MKNIVKNICIVLFIAIAGNFSAMGQESPKLIKDSKEKVETKATDVKKTATDLKGDKKAIQGDKKKQAEKAAKTAASEKGSKLDAATKKVKKGATDAANQNADEIDDAYKEKMDKATTTEERMALEKEMKKAQAAKRDLKGDTPKDGEATKGGAKKGKPIVTSSEDKDYTDLKGREFGQARASGAKKMIEKKEVHIAKKNANIVRSRDRIEAARKRVKDQVASGQISAEEATAKQAKIDRAEQRLKAYETRVESSKKKLSDHKTKVNDLYIKD